MGFNDIIKNSVLKAFSTPGFSTTNAVISLGVCFLIAVYIYFVYRFISRTTFYDKSFSVSMAMISVIVTGIILAMQANLIISLGMVGALSIVRFRTAVKEPMDLLFLFWSISTGIICGAGLYELAILVALACTMGILFLQVIPIRTNPYLIIINAQDKAAESDILAVIHKYSPRYKIDSKNIRQQGMDLIVEIRSKNANKMVDELSEIELVSTASLLYHDAPVKN
ncbi:MAG: DUF4956 domain-containing protein [Lachnospiraceae bacterium]|nr:DUF4956 domain-containing protein [Lachnospiraceae bacterium]